MRERERLTRRCITLKRFAPLRRQHRGSSMSVSSTSDNTPGMRWVRLRSSQSTVEDDVSATPEPRTPMPRESLSSLDSSAGPEAQRLRAYAARWPNRIGAHALRGAAGGYLAYLAAEPREEDAEQVAADIERSTVDGLEECAVPWHDPGEHLDALSRLLRAWCVRTPGGYCQGMNFCAAVLLVVMQHGEPGPTAAAGPTAHDPSAQEDPHASSEPAVELRRVASGGSDGEGPVGFEELAFWTFAAMMERLMPADFYQLPSMAGLQCDVRVLQQLTRSEIPALHRGGIAEDELGAVLKLTAYKWLIPCFVNQLPLSTLLHYWDRLLLRPPPHVPGARAPPAGLSAAHLQLSLALLHQSAEELVSILSAHPNEGMGLGLNCLLRDALARHDAPRLLKLASRFELSPAQLQYLRARLRHGAAKGHADPSLSGLQAATLALLSAQRSPARAVQFVMESMLLAPPPPPPIDAVAWVPPQHFGRFVSTCTLMFVAFCLWTLRSVSAPCRRSGGPPTLPV